MSLRIQIDCYHEYRCQCKPIAQTKVTQEQIAYNLIRCNPSLARYLGKRNVIAQSLIQTNQMKKKQQNTAYKSIIEEKNLNILSSSKHPQITPKQQQPQQPQPVRLHINNYISAQVQTSPLIEKVKNQQKRQVRSPRQKQIKQYFKQLRQTSRYLSDTGFRKYFHRQVFENYGRENTHGTNDGIIYGNYMKTHNINPHTGYNQPQDEETFYHALTAASPQKLLSPKIGLDGNIQNKSRDQSQSRYKEGIQSLQKPLKKHANNRDQIIGDNIRYHQKVNQLAKSKSKSKGVKKENKKLEMENKYNVQRSNFPNENLKINIIQGYQKPSSPVITSQYVNQKQIIQPVKTNQQIQSNNIYMSPRSHKISQNQQDINRLSEIKIIQSKCPVDLIKQNNRENILSKQCKVNQSSVKKNIMY